MNIIIKQFLKWENKNSHLFAGILILLGLILGFFLKSSY